MEMPAKKGNVMNPRTNWTKTETEEFLQTVVNLLKDKFEKELKPKRGGSRGSKKSKGGGKKDKGKGGKGKKVKTAEPPPTPSPPPVEPPPPKVKPKGTCYQDSTPGPGAYAATCLVGYYEHDPTKKREPAFTFSTATRYLKKAEHSIPGPKYNCDEVTRFGPARETGPIITGRHTDIHKGHLTPGPGHYSPEKYDNPRARKPPEARLLGRFYEDQSSRFTPGPGDYNTPSSIGDYHPTYNSAPSAHITGRSWEKQMKHKFHYTPGPNQYDYDNNVFLKSGPSARLLGRDGLKVGQRKDPGPGPGAYFAGFNEGADAPAFSFGRRHAPCVYVPPEDQDYSF